MTQDQMLQLMEVSQFIYQEARLQDEHRYDEWERLWTDDAIYWVPANGDDLDPEACMSIIYDNRSRLGLRVKQFYTGKRHTQMPQSRLCRVVSNIEVLGQEDEDLRVRANAIVFESHTRGEVLWACTNTYHLRRLDGQWRMARKKVVLANNHSALYTMSFLV
ncbi:MAG: aromatic-ring-hydroxylating dioxygenase subunit beta [Hydrogenophaga sp.]|uniref:Aromatic-ring-hydroxylating dioxygenase subunit beta n=1 Tax=Hydrogenophaga crocea TaxID=2716225 RepID=A0A6G8IKR1_9BURK|nr:MULTISPECIES: aromatic-ring-hydroxylating dioxygenase subunit beta [Hydrogenophaga]MBL0943734.1 aromatic-ring-hydroxylating dioxygenase subunit beta [Hydrogenophaga sp.]QIM53774.1 aromatic-ring-hydroxylating dioxygenase subunit beta [Hydrogenophaga crocea]